MLREVGRCTELRILYALYLPSSRYNCQPQHLPGISYGLSRRHSGQGLETDIAK